MKKYEKKEKTSQKKGILRFFNDDWVLWSRRFCLGCYDAVAVVVSSFLAIMLRFDLSFEKVPFYYQDVLYDTLLFSVVMTIVVFAVFRLYTSMWSYAGTMELTYMIPACVIDTVINAIYILLKHRDIEYPLPRSFYILYGLSLFILVFISRYFYRAVRALANRRADRKSKHNVLIVGAGEAGNSLIREITNSAFINKKVVGVIDDAKAKQGSYIHGVKVVGTRNDIIEKVKELGVHFEPNVVIGKSTTIDQLIEDEGFEAVFIGSGAGLPMFMGIPGENASGVFSANEYLTRSNLMKAFDESYDTPIAAGKKVAVVGGGNVAMDAARTALRLGAEVHIVYRRSEAELPARAEEVHHAKEEGIIFDLLTNPKEILVDENGHVKGMKVVKMELGEPDASGRRRPVEIPGSEYDMDVDTVIMSLGTSPNPLISSTTKGLDINKRRCIVAEEETGKTSKDGVYAGGDAVTGAATVILAMGAGKAGAKGIDEYLKNK